MGKGRQQIQGRQCKGLKPIIKEDRIKKTYAKPTPDRTVIEFQNQQFEKSRKKDFIYTTFWTKNYMKGMISQAMNFVECGLKSVENDLKHKRNQLKVLLLQEESDLTHELIDKAQKRADEIFEEKKKLAELIESRKQGERLAMVDEAYDKIFKETSEEYKVRSVQENKRYCAKINEYQMVDKYLTECKEKEEDKMWLAMHEKLQKLHHGHDEVYQKEAAAKTAIKDEIVEKQIYGKQKMEEIETTLRAEEKEFIKKMTKMYKEDEERFAELKQKKKDNFIQNLNDQMEENNRIQNKNKSLENLIDTVFKEQNDKEIYKELCKQTDNRAAEKHELDIFQESVERMREEIKEEEEELEMLIKQEVDKIEAIRANNRLRMRNAKEALKQEVLATRVKQIEEKKKKLVAQKDEMKRTEDYFKFRINQNSELEKTKEKTDAMVKKNHVENLKKQLEYNKVIKKREEENLNDWLAEQKESTRQLDIRADRLMQASLKGTAIHPFIHAFK